MTHKSIRNSNFSVNKVLLEYSHPLIYVMFMTAFTQQQQS